MPQDIVRLLETKEIKKIDNKEAKDRWKKFRNTAGFSSYGPLLTPPSANVKLNKSAKEGLIYGLSLAPASMSEDYQVCRYRSNTCEANCVAYAGKGSLPKIGLARMTKTSFLAEHPSEFVSLLYNEIEEIKDKNKIAVRLNTFSDIPWERLIPWFFKDLQSVQFYDYTKWLDRRPPKNYHLTYSASERTTDSFVSTLVEEGANVAVVFSPARTKALPETWKGLTVVDGDKTDARYLDKHGVVVGLRAKGSMRKNPGRMVRNV